MNKQTTHQNDDELQLLWRTVRSQFDFEVMIEEVRKQARFQRQFVRFSMLGMTITLITILWFDLQGVFLVPGLMTGIVLVSIGLQLIKNRRARSRCPHMASMSPEALLNHTLRHAQASYKAALYACTLIPASVVLGILVAPMLIDSEAQVGGPAWINWLIVVVLGGMTLASAAWGLWYSRRKRQEVRILKQRINEFEESL